MGSSNRHSDSAAGVGRDFEGLYRESYPAVYSYVSSRADADVVEDVVAEAFLEAARSFGSHGQARAGFSAWVVSIARNCMADRCRKVRTAKPRSVPEGAHAPAGGQVADGDGALADALLGCLDERELDLVLMRYRSGLRDAEIAEVMGMSEPAVSSGLARARSKMRAVARDSGA